MLFNLNDKFYWLISFWKSLERFIQTRLRKYHCKIYFLFQLFLQFVIWKSMEFVDCESNLLIIKFCTFQQALHYQCICNFLSKPNDNLEKRHQNNYYEIPVTYEVISTVFISSKNWELKLSWIWALPSSLSLSVSYKSID